LIIEGNENTPVRFISASMDEIAVDQGPYATIDGVFWKRKCMRQAIKQTWPNGHYDPEFEQSLQSDPNGPIMVCQDWVSCADCFPPSASFETSPAPITADHSRTKPWIPPRYFRLPGQAFGFGPGLLTLPTIKTLNKAEELTLKAAALAMSGVFTRVDDG